MSNQRWQAAMEVSLLTGKRAIGCLDGSHACLKARLVVKGLYGVDYYEPSPLWQR